MTADALIVFVKNKLKKELLEEYEEAQEEALEIVGKKAEEIKRAKAETSLKRAKEFIFEMKKML